MANIRYAAVTGCILLCGCNGRPVNISHFNPIFQTGYSPRPYIDPQETGSTVTRPVSPVLTEAVANDRLVNETVALARVQARVEKQAAPEVSSVDISEASSSTSTGVTRDGYTVSADGKLILPPPKKPEIIDLAQINRAMEADSADADILKIEADEAARREAYPIN